MESKQSKHNYLYYKEGRKGNQVYKVTCVAWREFRNSGVNVVQYGASCFKANKPHEYYTREIKKQIRATAVKRMEEAPVSLPIQWNHSTLRQKHIRRLLPLTGCSWRHLEDLFKFEKGTLVPIDKNKMYFLKDLPLFIQRLHKQIGWTSQEDPRTKKMEKVIHSSNLYNFFSKRLDRVCDVLGIEGDEKDGLFVENGEEVDLPKRVWIGSLASVCDFQLQTTLQGMRREDREYKRKNIHTVRTKDKKTYGVFVWKEMGNKVRYSFVKFIPDDLNPHWTRPIKKRLIKLAFSKLNSKNEKFWTEIDRNEEKDVRDQLESVWNECPTMNKVLNLL